jgi:hypothetical protein
MQDFVYFKGVEVQERGALHLHVVLVQPEGRPLHLSKRLLRALAIEHGFGHSLDVDLVPNVEAASKYVSKYVSKSCDERGRVPWPEVDGVKVKGARYRSWSSSRAWGSSMRAIRAADRELARARDGAAVPLDLLERSYTRELEQKAELLALALLEAAFWTPATPSAPPPAAAALPTFDQAALWGDPR